MKVFWRIVLFRNNSIILDRGELIWSRVNLFCVCVNICECICIVNIISGAFNERQDLLAIVSGSSDNRNAIYLIQDWLAVTGIKAQKLKIASFCQQYRWSFLFATLQRFDKPKHWPISKIAPDFATRLILIIRMSGHSVNWIF